MVVANRHAWPIPVATAALIVEGPSMAKFVGTLTRYQRIITQSTM